MNKHLTLNVFSRVHKFIVVTLIVFFTLLISSCEPTDPYQEMQDTKNAKYKDRLKKPFSGKKHEVGAPTKKEKTKEKE